MNTQNIGIGRALGWGRIDGGAQFQCVAAGLVPATVTVVAAAPGIVRIRMTPGAVPPEKRFSYVVASAPPPSVQVTEVEKRVTLATEFLIVTVDLDPWRLTFQQPDGRLLTQEMMADVNFGGQRLAPPPGFEVEGPPHDPARNVLGAVETLLLDPSDHFYGGGEKFTRLDHVGRTIRMWHRNPYGTQTELAYKNVPLIVGTRGYGLFVDVPTAVSFHLGSLSNRSYTIHAPGRELDYYLIAGSPKEIVGRYTDLTGKPAVPPEWAFGLWASSAFVQASEASVREQTRRLRAEGIPCDVFNFDCFWQKPLMWCDFEWDASRFPDPSRLLGDLHENGYHNCLWENPYISAQSPLYQEAAKRDFLIRRPDGSIYESILWSQRSERGMGLCGILDLTNPEVVTWLRAKHDTLLAQGADTFKPDFGEEVPEDARFHNGLTGADMHNPYPLVYQKEVFEAIRAHAGRGVIWGRSGAPGSQRYPGHWSGDPECTFADFASSLRGGLAASMSGFALWTHDMGGFWGTPTPELYVRWFQSGFFSSFSRYHGATARDPWLFGEEILNIFRLYAKLRSRLVPYLYSYAWDAAESGIPVMRPMVLEFSDDPAAYGFDLQYCLGRELLVSPVFSQDGWVTTYLPRGHWQDWWSGAILDGPRTISQQVPLERIPLYLRENSIVPLGPERNFVAERPVDPLTLEMYVTSEARFILRSDNPRLEFRCRTEAPGFTFDASDTPCTYILRVHQCGAPVSARADGTGLPHVDLQRLNEMEEGWALDGGIAVVKARARRIEIR
jgi:alpha-D-xyloside xylohydrolase